MRKASFFVLMVLTSVLVLVSRPTRCPAADGKDQDAELQWAKRTASEFLELMLEGTTKGELSTSPLAFLSPDLIAAEKELKEKSGLAQIAWQYRGSKFRITAEEMAPSGGEVILRGVLTPLSEKEYEERRKKLDDDQAGAEVMTQIFLGKQLGSRQERPADFTLRLARESKSGRWAVQHLRVKTKEPK
jgi:hypothetical protein